VIKRNVKRRLQEIKMDLIKTIEETQRRPGAQDFNVGDTVKVFFKIIEGKTERVQVFEGIVLCKKNEGARQTFTVRKISYGVGVERVFPYNSPRIVKVDVVRPGKVRRAKLYYLRDKIGKSAKVKTRVGAKVKAEMEARNARAAAAAKAKAEAAEAATQASAENTAQ
jgi:large subunit ribosomal protein L19